MKLRNVAAAYLGVFLCLFVPLAWRGMLPGNVDTVLGIALSNLLKETALLFVSGQAPQTVMAPAATFIPFGENCFGLGILYNLLRLVTPNDIWAHNLFAVALFSASAFAVFRFTSLFVRDLRSAFLAGLAFALSSFILANVDDLNVVFVFFPAMAFYEIENALRKRSIGHLHRAFLFSALQVWFGFYVFVIHSLALGLYLLLNFGRLKNWIKPKAVLTSTASFVGPALPIFALYLIYHFTVPSESPFPDFNANLRRVLSLDFHHFRNVLPGNLLYPSSSNVYEAIDASIPSRLRKTAFPGFLFLVVTAFGAFRLPKGSRGILIIAGFFLALSFGANLPGFEVLSRLPLADYFRSPLRFHVESLLMLAIVFAVGIDHVVAMTRTISKKWMSSSIFAIAGVVFVLENVPFPLMGFDFGKLMTPPEGYTRYFSRFEKPKMVLDLPTTLGYVVVDGSNVFGYNREMIYMNWQPVHRQAIAGGTNAYLPHSRIRVDRVSSGIPKDNSLAVLRELKIEFLCFHKNLVLSPKEDRLNELKESPDLVLEHEDADLAIFRMKP